MPQHSWMNTDQGRICYWCQNHKGTVGEVCTMNPEWNPEGA